MRFLSRLLVPRSVRRAMHPVRTVKRAAAPKIELGEADSAQESATGSGRKALDDG